MSTFWNFAFGAVLVLIWIISGGFITQANVKLSSYKNKDDELHRAYWASFWASFITWTLVGIFIILVILSVLGIFALFGTGAGEAGVAVEGTESVALKSASKAAGKGNEKGKGKGAVGTGISLVTVLFLLFALGLVILTGILSAISASSIAKSPNYSSSNADLNKAYKNCIISASMCLGATGIILIGIITYFVIKEKKKGKVANKKE